MNAGEFFSALAKRRTIYHIDKNIALGPERIMQLVQTAVLDTPSAFNSQSARAVVLLGAHHETLWGIVRETLRRIVPEAAFASTDSKISAFAAGAGTVLYFEDMDVITGLQQKFPLYKDSFPVWAQQANGMLQLDVWTALELEGLGASLQHYNPLIDDAVKAEWSLPDSWQLIAQMPFGNPTAPPDAKESMPASERVRMFR